MTEIKVSSQQLQKFGTKECNHKWKRVMSVCL